MDQLLLQYNPHWEDPKAYQKLIVREQYLEPLRKFLDRREIIVLMGIRRCGKSSMMKLLIQELLKRKVPAKNILFMNLEDYRFGSDKDVGILDAIYHSYRAEMKPKGKVYIMLDEIQEIKDFERWLRTYYEQSEEVKFIVTGSSSSLFSTELATLLTGRQVSIEIFPFSFKEYLGLKVPKIYKPVHKKQIDALYLSKHVPEINTLLEVFLEKGGFPEVLKHEDDENNTLLLQQYISDIILRDIASRYNIRKIEVLQKLTLYMIHNMSNEVNISRMAQLVGSNRTTVLELIAYLKEVYLIFSSGSFSFSLDEQLSSTRSKRYYCVDNGFFAAIKTESEQDGSKRLRNLVYQQLRFNWKETVFYWRGKVEIEFILNDGFPLALVEEGKSLDDTITRMFYYMSGHNLRRGILLNDSKLHVIDENDRRILLLPMWLFLTKSRQEIMEYVEQQ